MFFFLNIYWWGGKRPFVYLWPFVGSLSREQRRVWFADGILPNGETTDSSKGPAPNPHSSPAQPPAVSQISSKSTASTHEVRGCFVLRNIIICSGPRLIMGLQCIQYLCDWAWVILSLLGHRRWPAVPELQWEARSVWSQRTDFLPSSSPPELKEVREATSQVLCSSSLFTFILPACACDHHHHQYHYHAHHHRQHREHYHTHHHLHHHHVIPHTEIETEQK